MKPFVKDGTVKSVILWNTIDLGYLTVRAAEALASGKLQAGATEFSAGRLGNRKISGDNILLGDILIFTKENIPFIFRCANVSREKGFDILIKNSKKVDDVMWPDASGEIIRRVIKKGRNRYGAVWRAYTPMGST